MAQRILIELTDDLDGTKASETIRFGLEKDSFEIDLNENNARGLREVLAPYMAVARKAGTNARAPKASPRHNTKEVRAWAVANGIDVNPRGRVSEDVIRKYEAAQN